MIKNACRYLMSMLVVLGAAAPADADELSSCFRRASIRYDISQRLLEAIAHVESSGNPMAVNQNSNGSEDIGLMQINSFWLPKLEEYGITRQDLFDPCVNIEVGAWILADNIHRHGYSWEAVGAYNAASQDKRLKYARKVALALLGD
jgi:soluble lytic murein transglycosylase-like protein